MLLKKRFHQRSADKMNVIEDHALSMNRIDLWRFQAPYLRTCGSAIGRVRKLEYDILCVIIALFTFLIEAHAIPTLNPWA